MNTKVPHLHITLNTLEFAFIYLWVHSLSCTVSTCYFPFQLYPSRLSDSKGPAREYSIVLLFYPLVNDNLYFNHF